MTLLERLDTSISQKYTVVHDEVSNRELWPQVMLNFNGPVLYGAEFRSQAEVVIFSHSPELKSRESALERDVLAVLELVYPIADLVSSARLNIDTEEISAYSLIVQDSC